MTKNKIPSQYSEELGEFEKYNLEKLSSYLLEEIAEDLKARKNWEDAVTENLKYLAPVSCDNVDLQDWENYAIEIFETARKHWKDAKTKNLKHLPFVFGENSKLRDYFLNSKLRDYVLRDSVLADIYAEYFGFAIKKVCYSLEKQCPVLKLLPPFDVIIHRGAESVEDSTRVTHILYLTKEEILEKQKSGIYWNIDLPYLEDAKEEDKFPIYEVHLFSHWFSRADEEPNEEHMLPSIMTIDKTTEQIIAIRKNLNSETNERYSMFIEYTGKNREKGEEND